MSCKNCRNLINIIKCGDTNKISCETHSYYIQEPEECKGFLSTACKDKRRIEKNIKVVSQMYMANQEDGLE